MPEKNPLRKNRDFPLRPSVVSRAWSWARTFFEAIFLGDDEARYHIWVSTKRLPLPWKARSAVSGWTKTLLFPSEILQMTKPPITNKPEILFVSESIPFPDRNSGDQRLSHIMEAIGNLGFHITFASMTERGLSIRHSPNPQDFGRYESALQSLGVHKICYGQDALAKLLSRSNRKYRYAFVSFPHIATQAIPPIRRISPHTFILYDMVDYHGMRFRREAALRQNPSLLARAAEIEKLECEHARSSDLTIAVSEEDKMEFLKQVPEAKVEVLWDYFEIPANGVPGPEERNGILFVGGFIHQPNIDAVEWFAGEIFPLIRQSLPNALFHIAGSKMPPIIRDMATQPGIVVHGWVPDLSDLFRRSRVFVAPLRFGAGVKGKIGQSLSFGLPVVTTSIGAEGMHLIPGVNAEIANDPKSFSDSTIHLLENDRLWSDLSREGMDHVCRNWSADTLQYKIKSLFKKLDNPFTEGESP
ncbi:MAG: glycosyltransferase [Leptospirales bacterium]